MRLARNYSRVFHTPVNDILGMRCAEGLAELADADRQLREEAERAKKEQERARKRARRHHRRR